MDAKKDLLKKLNDLYILARFGVSMTAYAIENKVGIEDKIWKKLIAARIISNTSNNSNSKPHYTWIGLPPNITLVTELLKEYGELLKDAIINKSSNITEIEDNIYTNLKQNVMLHEKDQMFNWVIPKAVSGKKVTCDFKVNIKHNYIYIGRNFLNTNFPGIDHSTVKAAFLLEGDKQFVVINPPNGVPFYKFSSVTKTGKQKNAGNNTPALSNKQLTELLKIKFMITQLSQEFELRKFENINGMMFYQIVPTK